MEEIDVKELFYEIWKNRFLIFVFVFIGAAIGIVYSMFLLKPMYKSSTTMVLSKPASETGSTSTGITSNDITLNQKLVSTYREIMVSKTVVEQVINKLKLNMDVDTLINNITVGSKQDTEVLELTVSSDDPNLSASIANTLAEKFTDKVKEVYNIENVSIIDKAEADNEPYNINEVKTTLIFVVGALVLALVIIFGRFYLDDTIKNQEELERLLKLPILAVIPEIKE